MKATSSTAIVERLFNEVGFPLISIYMPTHRAGSAIWQDPIRFKNLMRSAEHDLETAGVSRGQISALLRPLGDLRDDRAFWQHQTEGLAVFKSASAMELFHVATVVPELSVVGSEYHLKPLLMALSGDESFYVLALSQNRACLYRGAPDGRGDADGLAEVEGLELPDGMELKSASSDNSPQSHSAGRGVEIHHTAELNTKARLREYCRQVDQAISQVVSANAPLILATVDQLRGVFQESTTRPGLLPESISGNPDNTAPNQLFKQALPIARRYFDSRRIEASDRFLACCHTSQGLDETAETIHAARQGRIETLFVPTGVQIWGQINDAGEITLSDFKRPSDYDLLNLALIETWKSGGEVFAVAPDQMPGGRQIAAVARF